MSASMLRPTAPGERIAVLDVLRGFALAGILLANLVSFVGYYELDLEGIRALPTLDRLVLFLIDWLVEGKFYALFSILFGMGFYLQSERARRSGSGFLRIWYRRMLALLLIGLLHMYLVWYGDILTLYALLGLMLPRFASLSAERLLRTACALLMVPLFFHALQVISSDHPFWNVAAGFAARLKEDMGFGGRTSLQMLASNEAREVLAANLLGALQRPMSYLRSGRYFQVLGLFLLGLWLARTMLPFLREGKPLSPKGWNLCAIVGLSTSFGYAWIKSFTGTPFATDSTGLLQGLIYHIGSTTLALAYAGALVTAWQTGRFTVFLSKFALLGRMALTNYLTQTTLCVLIFYGYGARLLGQPPFALIPLLTGLILVLQWYFCSFWLNHFEQGPLEYLWRKMTYQNKNSETTKSNLLE